MPANLLGCIKEFRQSNPHLLDPLQARSACGVKTIEFAGLLAQSGLIDYSKVLWGSPRTYEQEDPRNHRLEIVETPYAGDWHVYFRYGRLAIDWTARQHHPDCPLPYVYSIALMTLGGHTGWRPVSFLPRAGGEVPRY